MNTPLIYNYIRLVNNDGSELPSDMLPDLSDEIELNAEEKETRRIEDLLRLNITKPDESDYDLFTLDGSQRYINDINAYRETCNSTKLLYNILLKDVQEYNARRNAVRRKGFSNTFDSISEYYVKLTEYRRLVESCDMLNVSIVNGVVVNVNAKGRDGKDNLKTPLWQRKESPNLNTVALSMYVDPLRKWESVRKINLQFERDSDDGRYTFDEVRTNLLKYIDDALECGVRKRNTDPQNLAKRLECAYRYLQSAAPFKIKGKFPIKEFLCELLQVDGDIGMEVERYFGRYQKCLPTTFIYYF